MNQQGLLKKYRGRKNNIAAFGPDVLHQFKKGQSSCMFQSRFGRKNRNAASPPIQIHGFKKTRALCGK